MKTIIQVVQHLRPGGIETMALDLQAFCQQPDRAFIISLEGDRKTAIAHWPKLRTVSDSLIFLGKRSGLDPLLIVRLFRTLKKFKADVVHVHHLGPLLYGGIAARLAGIKHLIHTEHDAWHLDDPRQRQLQRAIIFLTHPCLVADADIVASSMRKRLNTESIHIIRNGIDTQRFIPGDKGMARQRLELPHSIKLIGCSGRLEKVKGQQLLIAAMSRLPNDVHLALAGAGSTETELRRLSEIHRVKDRVHFLGQLDEMPIFYQALDYFCLPSLNEGYPLAPLEAQACGIPTVVTDVGGSRETLCPSSGSLVRAGDVAEMATALNKMLQQSPTTNPRAFVQQQGDVRTMVNAYRMVHQTGV